MKLSILVPVFNERPGIETFWQRLKTAPIRSCTGIDAVEVIVVDDGSTDGTKEVLGELCASEFVFEDGVNGGVRADVRFFPLPQNRGKGHAIRHAISRSTGDIVVIQDSDLEYSPSDYPALIRPISENMADAVFGSRFTGSPRRVLYFWHAVINKFLTLLSNALFNLILTDMEAGYKVFRGSLIRSLRLTSDRFGIEPELASRCVKAKARIFEVPISYWGRTYDEGKKIRAKDGLAAVYHILKFALWDTEPLREGQTQTLAALDGMVGVFYEPALRKAIAISGCVQGSPRIIEIGAGIGSLSKTLLRFGDVTATDISAEYIEELRKRFENRQDLHVRKWDARTSPSAGFQKFDLAVAFNILEHIEDDVSALKSWAGLLNDGGKLIILVPCYKWLYSEIDRTIGHWRRYGMKEIREKLSESGYTVEHAFYSNAFGVFGWFFTCKLFGSRSLPRGQLGVYRVLKFFLGPMENLLNYFFGLNIIVVASFRVLGRALDVEDIPDTYRPDATGATQVSKTAPR